MSAAVAFAVLATLLIAQNAPNGRMAIDLLAVLAAASVVSLLGRRYRTALIPGFLIAGVLIGPHALGMVANPAQTQPVWQFATVLLLFTIGLHLDFSGARRAMIPALLVGLLSTIVSVLAGCGVIVMMGPPMPAALATAMALSLSSTAVVLHLQRRGLHRVHGRLAFGVLLVQDLLVLAMMALLPLLTVWSPGVLPGAQAAPFPGLADAAIHIGGIAALIIGGRVVFPRVLKAAAWPGETLLVVSAAGALGAGAVAAALGFGPELGAFLAGLLLAGTPFRARIAGQLAPLRDLFLAVFLTVLGLNLPLGVLADGWWVILIGLAALFAVKTLAIGGTAWAAGATAPVAVYAGVTMFQGGEFSLVLLARADALRVLTEREAAYAIAVVAFSLALTPLAMVWGRGLAARVRALPGAPWGRAPALRDGDADRPAGSGADKPPPLAIVAGFGPVGRACADTLERGNVRITIIELNPRTVERQHGLGRSIVCGDASDREVLERAGIDEAEAVILTMPNEEAVLRACRLIRLIRPDVFISARVNALSTGLQAMQLGADHTVVEEMATAEAMAAEVIVKLSQRSAGQDGPRLYAIEP